MEPDQDDGANACPAALSVVLRHVRGSPLRIPAAGAGSARSRLPSARPQRCTLPAIEKRTLSNGLPVWVVRAHKVPVVHVQLALKAGTGVDPAGKFGVASLTADMLDEGAGKRSASRLPMPSTIWARICRPGHSRTPSRRSALPSAATRGRAADHGGRRMRPTFPRRRSSNASAKERLTSFIEAQDDPESLIQFAFPRLLFGTAASIRHGNDGHCGDGQGVHRR